MAEKKCKDCGHKKPHVTGNQGKVYWYCNLKHTTVHLLDTCDNVMQGKAKKEKVTVVH